MTPKPHLPNAVGVDALTELDQVDWPSLHHAYGQGRVGTELYGDVAGSLNLIALDIDTALRVGLYSNICHQGTVYEASAYALPFIAAVAAGDVPVATRQQLVALIADIAVGGSHVSADGSSSGALGVGVSEMIRDTVVRCDSYLSLIKQRDTTTGPIIAAVRDVTISPSDETREAVWRLIDPDAE